MQLTKARVEFGHGGSVASVFLAAPKANILDQTMMTDLRSILEQLAPRRDLKAIILTSDGPSFSYGASVEEHLPEQIGPTLVMFRKLLEEMMNAPAPTIAAVRGFCLGGGLELVLACDVIIAEETAQFGSPEVKLGVFPPAAAALLPIRVGVSQASQLILTGENWSGTEAAAAGLVSRLVGAGHLEARLGEWLSADFLPRSAIALRYAARSIRRPIAAAIANNLPELETIYLEELMEESDPVEGIRAFLEKRPPRWSQKKSAG